MFSFSKKLLAGVVLVLYVGIFGTVLTVKAKGAITDSRTTGTGLVVCCRI